MTRLTSNRHRPGGVGARTVSRRRRGRWSGTTVPSAAVPGKLWCCLEVGNLAESTLGEHRPIVRWLCLLQLLLGHRHALSTGIGRGLLGSGRLHPLQDLLSLAIEIVGRQGRGEVHVALGHFDYLLVVVFVHVLMTVVLPTALVGQYVCVPVSNEANSSQELVQQCAVIDKIRYGGTKQRNDRTLAGLAVLGVLKPIQWVRCCGAAARARMLIRPVLLLWPARHSSRSSRR